jgi:hypothetical protein
VVVCERDLTPGSWKEVLDQVTILPDPPAFIVTSRLADERLWAESLKLGAFDVLDPRRRAERRKSGTQVKSCTSPPPKWSVPAEGGAAGHAGNCGINWLAGSQFSAGTIEMVNLSWGLGPSLLTGREQAELANKLRTKDKTSLISGPVASQLPPLFG